ncbi:nucleotidyltransferase and HEPN domain-containing protein [Hephaestia sp. GCM10023244]|uniref:nucleotidyltransferase and HEPN domain-containing protein n=1 Tax=unclassified Hephaestia TaxID=2631281 RepID=UPI0020776C82|nr:HEPN domain-containing protein [Hephaestia sp. MAHUQ-44]MCM8732392.1 HEPN domain-containing protein [Hephaestia sp. MAHUQ-44]
MRTGLDHLPASNQRELRMVADTTLDRFEEAHSRAATQWKKKGRLHKIILYGSYARGDWVYEPHTKKAYRSDYDLLIVVNHKRVVDNVDFWESLRATFMGLLEQRQMKVPVGIIVHTRQEFHNALAQGRFFFADVAREGIALYEDDDKPLPKPRPKTPESELALAREYFDQWYPGAGEFYDAFEFNVGKGRPQNAAFQLHQSVEQLYHTALLVSTFYTPHVHNIRHLRNEAAKIDRRFVYVWPEDTHWQRACFNLLKDAYVKARYSKPYRISAEHLAWLGEQAQELARVVRLVCEERIAALERRAADDAETTVVHLPKRAARLGR